MRVFATSAVNIEEISDLLLRGEVVAIPTETVYGLAADALNPDAVEEIYRIKGRPAYNPLIIHIHDHQSAENYAFLNSVAEKLMRTFWPGPLTLVLKKKPIIPDIVSANLETVGIRMPNHPVMHQILGKINRPLAAPSANPSNYISPTEMPHVRDHLDGKLKYVVDGGPCNKGVESTILDVSNPDKVVLLRHGPLSKAELEACIQQQISEKPDGGSQGPLSSPGQLKTHYSPKTRIELNNNEIVANCSKSAYLFFSKHDAQPTADNVFFLSKNSDHQEAEITLYSTLQKIDQSGFKKIIVAPIPDGDNWNAIRDRLSRAAHQ